MSGNSFVMSLDGHSDPITIASFEGREQLSRLYHFDVEMVAPSDLDLRALLGTSGHLQLDVGGKVRRIGFEIERVEFGRTLSEKRKRPRARLVPRLARLTVPSRSRVFQNMTTLDIVGAVLREHTVPWKSLVTTSTPSRVICMQHEERDVDFIERLLAEEGFAYRFEPPPEGSAASVPETLIVFEAVSGYDDLPDDKHLVYRDAEGDGSGLRREENYVSEFVSRRRKAPTHVLHREFDLQNPERFSETSFPSSLPVGLGSVHHHHGVYGEVQVTPQRASASLEQHRRKSDGFRGASECARLCPGLRVQLDEHEDPSLSGSYAVTAVRHTGTSHSVARGPDESTYKNTFSCVVDTALMRPPLPARRVRQSLETATVTGPAGEEINTDSLGRVEVLFHWDLDKTPRSHTSCWLRVAQSWAGPGWGSQFIPRVGMEVLVGFLGGDPDRPVVIGALNNVTHLPSFPLPIERARSGIKTQSTQGEDGYNELSFNDKAGGEEIRVVAQRDYNQAVKRNQTVSIGADDALMVSGKRSVTVTGAQDTLILGEAKLRYEGGATSFVEGRSVQSVEGHAEVDIRGDLLESVEGSRRSKIDGDRVDEVTGPFTQRAQSSFTLVVGSQDAKGHADFQLQGTMTMTVDGVAQIESYEKLRLVCGKSVIEIEPDGITISATTVKIKGTQAVSVEGNGPAMNLDKEAEIVADTLKIYGKKSSLWLDENATLKGTQIALASPEDPPKAKDDDKKGKTKKLKLKMTDESFAPYKSKHYLVRVDSVRLEGTTGDDGSIEADVPDTAKMADLTLWIETYPTGKKMQHTIVLDDLPAIDTVAGVQTRLKNLGYYFGRTDGETLDPETAGALTTFQTDHELKPTGVIDDATKGELTKRHGS